MIKTTITLTKGEQYTIKGILDNLLTQSFSELNKTYGSTEISIMEELARKLNHWEYCENHGITYEQMTDDDFEAEYREKYEA